jgi:hypothetical protein
MIHGNEKLWKEILEITKDRYLPPSPEEITTIDFMNKMYEETGSRMARRTAHDILQRLVRENKLKCRKYLGRNVYSLI